MRPTEARSERLIGSQKTCIGALGALVDYQLLLARLLLWPLTGCITGLGAQPGPAHFHTRQECVGPNLASVERHKSKRLALRFT